MKKLELTTENQQQMIDITKKVQAAVDEISLSDGVILIYTPHTTCALTINENADPDVKQDILLSLDDFVRELDFSHDEGNSQAHVRSSLFGCSQSIIVDDGKLQLGMWQGIYLCEFDGPRTRQVWIKKVG